MENTLAGMTAKELKNGKEYFFNNEAYQMSINDDDIRQARVIYKDYGGRNAWATGFVIWFNGTIIHSCKGFDSLKRRLNILIEKWNLIEGELEE